MDNRDPVDLTLEWMQCSLQYHRQQGQSILGDDDSRDEDPIGDTSIDDTMGWDHLSALLGGAPDYTVVSGIRS